MRSDPRILTFFARGGSLAAEFSRRKEGLIETVQIYTAVRSEEQAKSLSRLNVQLRKVEIIVHTATSVDRDVLKNLIDVLGVCQKAIRKECYFVHMDTFVVEQLKAANLTGFIIMPPTLHGRGGGTWNQLPPQIPALVKANIQCKHVYKFTENRSSQFPGKRICHPASRATIFQYLILCPGERSWNSWPRNCTPEALYSTLQASWTSDEMVAEAVGVPVKFAASMWNYE
ncbi:hypothetical protein N7532_007714 [Penicillium argentinense]|uniref:Uncharacterized protein n=1 Tax=Penicillium argentinense TaxID=1131581 RepID=A0A9W9EWA1_9EURO|nr:uncharacterized protein N7532_007714 [Penicillium argentinense]KAJ5089030.1 hypothetical protein N7532_007714 [Penicillium argentinense]